MSVGTNRIITPLIVVFVLLTSTPTFAGKIIYVDDDSPADFNNIQAAIDDSNNGDTIIVAEGRYFENINFNGRNITLTSTDPCSPDVVAATIIEGNQNGSAVTFNSGEDANCVLNGFTITNGNAKRGGGISCALPPAPPPPPPPPPLPPPPPGTLSEQSSPEVLSGYGLPCPTITNCVITGNTASRDGGGIYCGWIPGPPPPVYNFTGPTITNCFFSENTADRGGGMYNAGSNTTLANCTFNENSADSGGAMYNGYYSSPTLANCIFNENSAVFGGGMFNLSSNLTIANCTFNDNSAHSGGGMCNYNSSPTLTNCTFSENSAESGGGMYNSISNPTLANCTFTDNSAVGGGVYGGDGGGMCNSESSPTITNCTFTGNSAVGGGVYGGDGGGMCNYYSSPILTNCTFNGNSAESGGGFSNYDSSPTLANCIFNGNSAGDSGGGMHNGHSSPILTNCTFTDNSAAGSGIWGSEGGGMTNFYYTDTTLINCTFSGNSAEYGGGMYNRESSPTLTNCIFSGNLAIHRGGGMYNRNISSPILTNCTISGNRGHWAGGVHSIDYSIVLLKNCILWANTDYEGFNYQIIGPAVATYTVVQGGYTGAGNIEADPCFVAPGHFEPNCVSGPQYPQCTCDWIDGDYHLLPDSPCVNAGDPNHLYDPNERDLDGKPRVIGCRIDMGAFEYWQLVPAEARIVPRTINLANQGKWITCYIYLPEAYNVNEIDFCVLLLEYEIEPEQLWFNEKEQVVIAKFSREEVQDILDIGEIELTISAQLMDGTVFEGTDLIRVIYEGGGKLAKYGKASNPDPADEATGLSITADLSWTAGYGATSHDVYFGTSSTPPFVCNQTAATFDPGTMVYSTTYYWRIDEVNKWGKTTGQVWSFTTKPLPPLPPTPPSPPP